MEFMLNWNNTTTFQNQKGKLNITNSKIILISICVIKKRYTEVCDSPQKHKLLVNKTKEDESQRFIFNKVKLSNESKDFAVKYYSTITISN